MPKERVEDLGRLYVMLDTLSKHDIFDFYHGRTKDFPEWFREQDKEKQDEILHNIGYALKHIDDALCDMFIIARGLEGDD